jgi:hypothetical protein
MQTRAHTRLGLATCVTIPLACPRRNLNFIELWGTSLAGYERTNRQFDSAKISILIGKQNSATSLNWEFSLPRLSFAVLREAQEAWVWHQCQLACATSLVLLMSLSVPCYPNDRITVATVISFPDINRSTTQDQSNSGVFALAIFECNFGESVLKTVLDYISPGAKPGQTEASGCFYSIINSEKRLEIAVIITSGVMIEEDCRGRSWLAIRRTST